MRQVCDKLTHDDSLLFEEETDSMRYMRWETSFRYIHKRPWLIGLNEMTLIVVIT